MRIFYTTKRIFWSNEGQDYLESTQFNEFFSNQWIELPNIKSINWTSHYEASFYATDAFEATYFKIEKNNQTYYFFVQDIKNDSANGKFWYLTLDLYSTYGMTFIERLKGHNPPVSFKRKHCNRYFRANSSERSFCFDFNRQRYLLTPPSSLNELLNNTNNLPVKSFNLNFVNDGEINGYWVNLAPGTSSEKRTIHLHYNPLKYYEYVILKSTGKGSRFESRSEYINRDLTFNYILVAQYDGVNPDGSLNPINVGYITNKKGIVDNFYGWSEDLILKLPSDIVIGRVKTPIPPSVFGYFFKYSSEYNSPNLSGYVQDQFLVLTGTSFVDIALRDRVNFLSMPDTEAYFDYSHEPILELPPFTKLKMNGNVELSPLSFFKPDNGRVDVYISSNKQPWTTVVSSSLFFRPPRGALSHDGQTQYFSEITHKKPAIGDVLNNYLLNNANAVSTGLQSKIGTSALSILGNFINGFSALNPYGAALSGVGIAQSVWGVSQTIMNHVALKSDLGNRVDDVKDVYGKGVTVEDDQVLIVSKYEQPTQIKNLVFKDIYFNGYEFNGVERFKKYDNRVNFNYFEISDTNQFLNLYTTFPKQIINDLSEKFLNGIRLWKTQDVKFDLSLDNREIDFRYY